MNATLESVFSNALELPESSRLSLVEKIIATLPGDPEVEQEHLVIAETRLEEMRAGFINGTPVEDAIQRVRESLSKKG